MITNDEFLKQVREIYKSEFFVTPYISIISKWCVDYFDDFDSAPKTDIQQVFNSANNIQDDMKDLIEDFLVDISEEYDEDAVTNVPYLTEQSREVLQETWIRSPYSRLDECSQQR